MIHFFCNYLLGFVSVVAVVAVVVAVVVVVVAVLSHCQPSIVTT